MSSTQADDVAAPQAIEVAVLSQRGWITEENLSKRLPGGSLDCGSIRFVVGDSPSTDVVVIQNYLRYDKAVHSRKGYVWKWDLEPIVKNPIVRGYDRVFTHLDLDDTRVSTAPPILDWWVGKSFDELLETPVPSKTEELSAIASTKDWISGHRLRGEFISRLETEFPEVDIFGQGRARALDDKWDGLAPYRYSVAIENTSKPDYWTEKISDCFLSYTVPFYYGATNIGEYFPEGSFIWLPIDNPDEAVRIIRDTLKNDSWDARLDALTEARSRVLNIYSLYAQISRLVEEDRAEILAAPRIATRVHGRRTRKGGWIRGVGLRENIAAVVRRRQERQRTKSE